MNKKSKHPRTANPNRTMPPFAILAVMLFFAASCVSNEKIIYVQNLKDNPPIPEEEMIFHDMPEYKLQFNDIIRVDIQTIDDLINNGFNATSEQTTRQMVGGGMGAGDIFYLTGYAIDKYGNVRLPVIGEVNIMEKTLEEARIEIESRLREFVTTELFVKVRLGGIRFSTLGEFNSPGKFVVMQDRLTIFEALSLSGDLRIQAKRDEILLFRQYSDGTKLHRINLRDRQLMQSPFYFIRPNDQLYAEPMRVREIGTGENAMQTFFLITSTLTTLLLLLNLFTN